MMEKHVGVKEIWQIDDRFLGIKWTDQLEQKYDTVELRRQCPCASCVDEMTGKRTLKPQDIADSTRPKTIDSVGRYAMSIKFSDGHGTGIYTFPLLRRLGQTI